MPLGDGTGHAAEGNEAEVSDGEEKDEDDAGPTDFDASDLLERPPVDTHDHDEEVAPAPIELVPIAEEDDALDSSEPPVELSVELNIPGADLESDDANDPRLDIGVIAVADEASSEEEEDGPLESPEPLQAPPRLDDEADDEGVADQMAIVVTTTPLEVRREGAPWPLVFDVALAWSAFAPYDQAVVAAGDALLRIDHAGTLKELCKLAPGRVLQVLAHEEGVLQSRVSGLELFSERDGVCTSIPHPSGRWPAAPVLSRHLGRTIVYAGESVRWILSGHQLQALPLPDDVVAISEQSGEYALLRGAVGTELLHLPTKVREAAPSLHARRIAQLSSLGGRLIACLQDQSLQIFDSAHGCHHQLALAWEPLALTLGLAQGEPLSWLALRLGDGRIQLVELELESGRAARIWESDHALDEEADVALRWHPEAQALIVGLGPRLLELARPR